jgi:hypothetical protein
LFQNVVGGIESGSREVAAEQIPRRYEGKELGFVVVHRTSEWGLD